MISACYEIGILCAVMLWIFNLKYRKGAIGITIPTCVILYFFSRVFPILMLSEKTTFHWINLAIDFVSLAILLWFRIFIKKKFHFSKATFLLYLANPAAAAAVVTGKISDVLILCGIATFCYLILLFCHIRQERKVILDFYPVYILFSYSAFFYLIATQALGQTFAMCRNKEQDIPTLLIISTAGMILTAGYALLHILLRRLQYQDLNVIEPETKEETVSEPAIEKSKLNKKDAVIILALTCIMAALSFFRLGAMYEPQTTDTLVIDGMQGNEIVLDLGEAKEVEKISIFFGNTAKRIISFSTFNETTSEWETFAENYEIGSAYCWEEVQANVCTRYLGIVCMDQESLLSEIAVVDPDGYTILPVNATDYPLLFDEQAYYPQLRSYYYRTMFDEIYHARTANEILNGDKIYENTHPQLGKILMGIGIAVFGMNPFGYRFMCAVFGILMVPVIYLFAHKLFGRTRYAVLASLLLIFEFMHYTLSRIGTLDIIIAFFVILMFYLMYVTLEFIQAHADTIESEDTTGKEKGILLLKEAGLLLLTGLSTGCAIATKWTGLYAAAGLAVLIIIYLVQHYPTIQAWKKAAKHLLFLFLISVVSFLLIPGAIYVISFYPFLAETPQRGLLKTAYDISIYMYNYHKDTIFDHPYSSPWYEWLYCRQPLLDAVAYPGDGTVSSVATLGNPVIWLLGLVALLYQTYRWVMKKDREAQYLCICYLTMLVPWMLVYRTVFIYQYFCSALMLIPMLAGSVSHSRRNERKYYLILLILAGVAFAAYFPVLSGVRVPQYYVSHFLEWIPEWIFE